MTTLYHPTQQPSDIPNTSGVYKIVCVEIGRFYVGSTINLKKRRREHFRALRRNTHYNSHLQAAWNKYGEDAFTFEVLELVLPMFQLEREQYWLDKLQPWSPNGFNMTRAANSTMGREISQATREKLRSASLGKTAHNKGKKATHAQREKMSIAHKNSPMNGKTWIGRKHSPETCAKFKEIAKNRPPVSDETRKKISLAGTGQTRSLETRAKMGAAKKKTLIIIAPDGTEHTVHGIDQFCKEYGLLGGEIMQVAKGKRKQHKGWTARLPTEEEVS